MNILVLSRNCRKKTSTYLKRMGGGEDKGKSAQEGAKS